MGVTSIGGYPPDTSFRSEVKVSWSRNVEVVTGSCRTEIPQVITPNSMFAFSTVCCCSKDHSNSAVGMGGSARGENIFKTTKVWKLLQM
jgi:hypothetical protein